MTTLVAYDWFAARKKRQRMPVRCKGRVIDMWPAMMTAAVRLLNWLDDAVSDQDLLDAVNHFVTCLVLNLFTVEQWKAEAKAVLREVTVEHGRLVEVRA